MDVSICLKATLVPNSKLVSPSVADMAKPCTQPQDQRYVSLPTDMKHRVKRPLTPAAARPFGTSNRIATDWVV